MSNDTPQRLSRDGLAQIFQQSRFIHAMKLEILDMDYDQSRLAVRMPLRPEIERGAVGSLQFHGGALAALIDVAGDFALGMFLGGGVPTVNLHIDYLRPAVGAYVDATATVRKQGRSFAIIDIEITAPTGKLVAIGRGTYVPAKG